ncbi:MAG TPA: cyclic pyranopterin monophosphate synthase MoaC [Acidobacteriota bacterium]|nr:cyclic pyranopterin monophosphate synthase MoaC [Acidobacteriota bacterium]
MEFSHFDETGRARMVDIGSKPLTFRRAVAEGVVRAAPETLAAVREGRTPKGDPLEIARLAGIQAAKRTAELIPLCHPLLLDHVEIVVTLEHEVFRIRSEVKCRSATGVEMEALVAVTVAALTVYDMCKGVDSGMVIGDVRLVHKEKSASGYQSD